MAKEWCVKGLKLKFTINGQDVTKTGTVAITSQPSDKTKIDGNGVYFDTFKCTFAGGVYNGYTQASPASYSISCGAKYSKENNKPIMLVEDNQTAKGISFVMGQTATTFDIKCEVEDPGQDFVKEK